MNTNAGPDSGPILVPVDFSESAEAALLWAIDAARGFGASIVVLHVVHDPQNAPGSYVRVDESGNLLHMDEAGREMLDEFMARMRERHGPFDGVTLEPELVVGLPVTRILEVAEAVGARMIVMGSCGRSGLRRFLLGSKAQRVLQLAHVPVTIVKALGDPEPDS